MSRHRGTVVSLLLLAALAGGSARAQDQSPETLARRLQQRYDGIRDFRADFTQTTLREVTRTQNRAEGTIAVKKPGLVRMVYRSPEKKEVVHDGAYVFDYVPQDRTVIKTPVPPGQQAPTAMLFLSGTGDILRDFVPSHTVSPLEGTIALKLTPRKTERDYEYLILALDPTSLQIRALVTHNAFGGETQIVFTDLEENTGLRASEFTFTIPRGVEVLEPSP